MNAELLAPAGDFETALTAFEAGADAVYLGLNEFSARAFATNFSFAELEKLLSYARSKKVYVTFNTLVDEDQFEGAIETLAKLEEIGPDGVIVQDLGIAKLIREHFPALALHASTQLVTHNLEGVLALKDLGFKRVVLARELSLEEITSIAKRCGDVELEVFIHGALCYSLSGLCLYGAMEKGRSGNRGKCPYCCRQGYAAKVKGHSEQQYPFSMKDLRLGENARKLVEVGVASLKIEGRMKSPLYVASVTKYYRQILDQCSNVGMLECSNKHTVRQADLETVFSRRTTKLYFDGRQQTFEHSEHSNIRTFEHSNSSPIDPESLGHLGTLIGTVKKVTRDREGLFWLRFHTCRELEKHDGLQFAAVDDNGKHLGMGIAEMRQAISRRLVFEVAAGVDVEILLSEEMAKVLKPGMKIYCSMSNAVKRMFPIPSFRPSDYEGGRVVDIVVKLRKDKISVDARQKYRTPEGRAAAGGEDNILVALNKNISLVPAKSPERTTEALSKAFSKLGGTGYRLGEFIVDDPEKLFVPMSVLNDLRRELVEELNTKRDERLHNKIEAAKRESLVESWSTEKVSKRCIKVRAGQLVPNGDWDEIIVAITADTKDVGRVDALSNRTIRLATPIYTSELTFNKLRSTVKHLLRVGFDKWECSDLATLRMLKTLGVTDITADWSLYAFNARALGELSAMGVRRFVASPENNRVNLQYLAESGYNIEFLAQQSTPLFISLTQPQGEAGELLVFNRDGLWVTTKPHPRTFDFPEGVSTRLDLSWDSL